MHTDHANGHTRSYKTSYTCENCQKPVHWDGTIKAYIADKDLDETCGVSTSGHNC